MLTHSKSMGLLLSFSFILSCNSKVEIEDQISFAIEARWVQEVTCWDGEYKLMLTRESEREYVIDFADSLHAALFPIVKLEKPMEMDFDFYVRIESEKNPLVMVFFREKDGSVLFRVGENYFRVANHQLVTNVLRSGKWRNGATVTRGSIRID